MIEKGAAMDIWSLHRQGLSYRSIAKRVGLDRRTVQKYVESEAFPVYHTRNRASILTPYYGLIRDWLATDDYSATWIHDRLKLQGFTGSYDIVKRFVRQEIAKRARLAYVRFETEPGLQAQVDFSDFKVREPEGTESVYYLFAMVLGYSRVCYAEIVDRCTMKQFLECHQRAFGYLGGIPGEILYDNMKNVVIRHLVGRVDWNRRFADFAAHYQFKPVACPPYSPWHKGKVERPFHYIRERFWRGYQFADLTHCNSDLLTWLNQTANCRIHGTVKENIKDRWAREKPLLGDIPRRTFDTSDIYIRKVYKDCMIRFQCNAYMVPHRIVGEKVMLKVHDKTVCIYNNDELLVVYLIPEGKGKILQKETLRRSLLNDTEMLGRKYRTPKKKGKATRGLLKDITDYESLIRDPNIYNVLTGVSS